MSITAITAIAKIGFGVIDRLFPNPVDKMKQVMLLKELEQKGDMAELNAHVQLMVGQMEINKEEAKSGSMFVAGWRPFIGWTAGIGLGVAFVPKAIMVTVLWSWQAYVMLQGCLDASACDIATYALPPFPDLGITDLLGILGAMLGVGAMRSFDKAKNSDTKRIN